MQVFSIQTVHNFRHYILLAVFHSHVYCEGDQAHYAPACEFGGMARALHCEKVHGPFVVNIPDFQEAAVYAAAYYSQN